MIFFFSQLLWSGEEEIKIKMVFCGSVFLSFLRFKVVTFWSDRFRCWLAGYCNDSLCIVDYSYV